MQGFGKKGYSSGPRPSYDIIDIVWEDLSLSLSSYSILSLLKVARMLLVYCTIVHRVCDVFSFVYFYAFQLYEWCSWCFEISTSFYCVLCIVSVNDFETHI